MILIKLDTNLLYFHTSHLVTSPVGNACRGNGSVQRDVLFLKNLYEFQGFGANRLMKEYISKRMTEDHFK